jgi:hypothetical protein
MPARRGPEQVATPVTFARRPTPAAAQAAPHAPSRDEVPIASPERKAAEPVAMTAPSPAEALPPDRAELAARELEAHRELVRQHDEEPRDVSWAAAEEALVRGRLEDLRSRAAFELGAVDCRQATCVAQLSWESPAHARAAYAALFLDCSDDR